MGLWVLLIRFDPRIKQRPTFLWLVHCCLAVNHQTAHDILAERAYDHPVTAQDNMVFLKFVGISLGRSESVITVLTLDFLGEYIERLEKKILPTFLNRKNSGVQTAPNSLATSCDCRQAYWLVNLKDKQHSCVQFRIKFTKKTSYTLQIKFTQFHIWMMLKVKTHPNLWNN